MWTLCLTVIGASLLGSVHCAGMCGGLVALFAGGTTPAEKWRAHLAWHGARLLTYVLLGALAGGLGNALDLASGLAGWPRLAAVLAGGATALWGLWTLLQLLGVRLPAAWARLPAVAPFQRVVRTLHMHPPVVRATVLGFSSALLPCGWLYAFVFAAAGTANAWAGALVMAAFWLGNLPLLAGVGAILQRLSGRMRRHLPIATAAALLVVGVLTMVERLQMQHLPTFHAGAALQEAWRDGRAGATCHGSR